MAKIFTITEGLENMGAIRSGGQGSIYKGKRTGEIIVAVKLLPTPILYETNDDKNYRDFRNEVEKLKKVNEEPNPNVVKILNSGITESGSFPFIEMEFIEGPDLEDLLKDPHPPVFSIQETIKVAEQLAHALSHCHKVSVKHGDIKSNNVKFNINTGNYMLLDFGLAIMSDELRRTSLRHAGAVEFMAPEQNEGVMLFQSDIYSYGIILYELLAGSVPFPLKDNGQTSRNTVMVSHMEIPAPAVLELRRENLPESWSAEKKEKEMQVPQWLTDLISKCLQKDPEDRFSNGMELYATIRSQSGAAALDDGAAGAGVLQSENERLQAIIRQNEQRTLEKEQQIMKLQESLNRREEELRTLKKNGASAVRDESSFSISRPLFYTLLLMIAGLSAFAGYQLIADKSAGSEQVQNLPDTTVRDQEQEKRTDTPLITKAKKPEPINYDTVGLETATNDSQQTTTTREVQPAENNPEQEPESKAYKSDIGKVFGLAVPETYFHNKPDESTRRKAFINHWNNARLTALNDENGFIYVIYTNEEGETSKGWLNKKDLIIIGE
jgi:serine/threonine protein kinase